MSEKDIIIDPIITHNNYLIEVEPAKFVNVTQLYREHKQLQQENQQLEYKLKQRDSIIEEAIKCVTKEFDEYHEFAFGQETKNKILEILNKYKGDNNDKINQ